MNSFLVPVELDLFEGPDDDPHVVDVSELETAADVALFDIEYDPVEGSLVGFGLRFEFNSGTFVQSSVINAVKFDEIRPKTRVSSQPRYQSDSQQRLSEQSYLLWWQICLEFSCKFGQI